MRRATDAAIEGGAEAFLDPKEVDGDANHHMIEAVSMQSRSMIDRHAGAANGSNEGGWNQALLGALTEAEDGSDSEDWEAAVATGNGGAWGGGRRHSQGS